MILLLFLISPVFGYSRLSSDVYPTKYHLVIHPKFSDLSIQGNLSILLVMNNTDSFSLDCQDLNVTWSSLVFDNEWTVDHQITQDNNRLHVKSSKTMKESYEVEFNLTYQGHLRKDLEGFYLSTYEYNGHSRMLGSTHFEALGARKAFPCFDEPSFRANFTLEILVEERMSAISNMPIVSNTVLNGTRRIRFSERPSIPVYLVAWVIYDTESFGNITKSIKNNCSQYNSLDYSVWSDLKFEKETALALKSAPEIVSALETFTGVSCEAVKYKMDLVAIPDFKAGAMENWEIITFRESALLYNNISSTVLDKQSIIMIVAHELVHQWFGNLVTPQWWSYTWLNEGFARYLQYVIANQLYPEMKLEEQFLVDRRQLALQTDDMSSHPLSDTSITTSTDISNMFDVITYDKGASVIHMWKSVIGHEEFRVGLKNYLNTVRRAGGVSNPDYLFSALFNNSTYQNKQIGSSWTEKSGYPIVIATEENHTLALRQCKVIGWNTTEASDWLIPVDIHIDNKSFSYMMEPNKSLTIEFNHPIIASNYVININQSGYYRVMYESKNRWMQNEANDITKAMLIDDAMALSRVGLLPYSTSIAVASLYLNTTAYLPWVSGLRAFSAVSDILKNSPYEQKWRELVLGLMNGLMEKVALNDSLPDDHITKLHKMNLLKQGCNYGHKRCLEEANNLASNLSNGTPEKQSALLCTIVKQGNDSTWNKIYGLYNDSNSPTEKQLYLKALTCTRNRTTIQKFLQLMLTTAVRKHDVATTIALICESPEGAEETLKFLEKDYTAIYNHFGEWNTIQKILSSATKFINDSQLAQIKQMKSLKINLNATLKRLEQTLTLKKQNLRMISDFFSTPHDNETAESSTGETTGNNENTNNGSSKIYVGILYLLSLPSLYTLYKHTIM